MKSAEIAAIFDAMGLEAQINREMRAAIMKVFETALLAFDDIERVEFGEKPAHNVRANLWPFLDDEFSQGIAGSGLSDERQREWMQVYEATKRTLSSADHIGR